MDSLAEYEVPRQHHEDTRGEVATERPATMPREDREAVPYVVRDLSWALTRYLDTEDFSPAPPQLQIA